MRHEEIPPQLKAFLDGELDAQQETEVREHVAACADCRSELERLSELCWQIGQFAEPEAPPDLRGRILEGVRRPSRRSVQLRWALGGVGALAVAVVCVVALRTHGPTRSAIGDSHHHRADVASSTPGSLLQPHGPVVWHEAVIEVRVANLEEAWKATHSLAGTVGGQVYAYERNTADVGAGQQRALLSVPLGRLRSTLDALGKLGRVAYRSAKNRDLTREVTDTNRLIAMWRAYEEGCVRAMADAMTVPQVLEMDREVASARDQIARLQRHVNSLVRYGDSGMITIYLVGPAGKNPPMSAVSPPPTTVA